MIKKIDKKFIKKTITPLIGFKLTKIEHYGEYFFFHFGDMVKIVSDKYFDENNKPLETLGGEYAFDAICFFRLLSNDKVLLTNYDMYELTDEKLSRLDTSDFIVESIIVNDFGDVTVKFKNRCLLEIKVDVSGDENCWRFFRSADDYDLVNVSGKDTMGFTKL